MNVALTQAAFMRTVLRSHQQTNLSFLAILLQHLMLQII